MNRIVPASSSLRPANTSAVAMSIAVCASWLLISKFGMLVDVATPSDELGFDGGGPVSHLRFEILGRGVHVGCDDKDHQRQFHRTHPKLLVPGDASAGRPDGVRSSDQTSLHLDG
jgi:hypothetical protein